jgi:hypothetical protein
MNVRLIKEKEGRSLLIEKQGLVYVATFSLKLIKFKVL